MTHHTSVERSMVSTSRHRWVASCSCGWRYLIGHYDDASYAARQHRDQMLGSDDSQENE